jgi:hypothetical protein
MTFVHPRLRRSLCYLLVERQCPLSGKSRHQTNVPQCPLITQLWLVLLRCGGVPFHSVTWTGPSLLYITKRDTSRLKGL